jgi:Bacteriocin-protection, YdeI or OmpD-Associated/Domain of unknown function (DUF1905)
VRKKRGLYNMAVTFTTTLQKAEGLNATGIRIPAEVIAALGTQKRPKVKVSLNGYTFRSTVAVFGDVFMLGVSQAHREASGLEAGDELEVTLELDVEPRIVDVPDDLRAALAEKAGALEAFEAMAFSRRKEFVRQVEEAKAQETRDRRIAGIVAQMGDKER